MGTSRASRTLHYNSPLHQMVRILQNIPRRLSELLLIISHQHPVVACDYEVCDGEAHDVVDLDPLEHVPASGKFLAQNLREPIKRPARLYEKGHWRAQRKVLYVVEPNVQQQVVLLQHFWLLNSFNTNFHLVVEQVLL